MPAVGGQNRYINIFRWYHATWGRYTAPDPIGLKGGLNLFAYVGGNPVNAIDPLGLIRIVYDFNYHAEPWRDCIISDCGNTRPRLRVDYECTNRDGCWRLQFIATIGGDVRYRGSRTLRHEQRHVDAFIHDALHFLSYLLPAEHRGYVSEQRCREAADSARQRLRQMPFNWDRRQRPIDWYIFY